MYTIYFESHEFLLILFRFHLTIFAAKINANDQNNLEYANKSHIMSNRFSLMITDFNAQKRKIISNHIDKFELNTQLIRFAHDVQINVTEK